MELKKTSILLFLLLVPISCRYSRSKLPQSLVDLYYLTPPNNTSSDSPPQTPPQDTFQHALDLIRSDVGVRGMSATIIDPNGTLISSASNMPGKANPVNTDMIFGIGSMSKTYIEYCLFQLIESSGYSSNPLTLDSKIGTWLYEGSNPLLADSFKTLINPDITVGQLMNHTSGIYDYQFNPLYIAAILDDTNKVWSPMDILRYVSNPSFSPGTQYAYSNTNYILLGMIIEQLTGNDVLSVFWDQVISPYNFSHTFMRTLEPVIGNIAVGYEKDINGNYYTAATFIGSGISLYSSSWVCGNIVTTSGELARWMSIYYAYQKSHGYIDGADYKRFWSTWNNDELNALCTTCTAEYGLCMMKFDLSSIIPGCIVYGHTGRIPGYTGFLMYWPGKDISVAVLMNDYLADRYKVLLELLEYLSTIY
jgi:D-alanyl-D-alanine carboxypeptidase